MSAINGKTKRVRSGIIAFLLLIFSMFAACGPAGDKAEAPPRRPLNFIVNPSFEEIENGSPAGWRSGAWRGKAEFSLEPGGKSGSVAAAISSAEAAGAYWVTIARIEPYSRYRLRGWIKTEGLEPGENQGAVLSVRGWPECRTPAVGGTKDWTKVEVEFDAGANDAVEVMCLLGGRSGAGGTAYYDDIELIRLSGQDLSRPEVEIEVAVTGKPMSKYIYGQFIEHLGRCIYQGIWAEMFEDRKFFYPVGGRDSVWKVIGDPAGVQMNRARPYVGEHSPRISLSGDGPAGIYQEGLAFEAGKTYRGRIVLAGGKRAAPVRLNVIWNEATGAGWSTEISGFGNEFETFLFEFTAAGSTDKGRLEIVSSGRDWFSVGTLSLMPADNVNGFRPDVISLLKELDAPVYRWPGGNFVSGYDWRDGIGERDRRPPRKNPAWLGVEHNDVGLHEFLDLMEIIGSEPYITVNSGLGDVKMAADEVEYVNGPAGTPMGDLRAKNGHPEPWQVVFWAVGNEMYGSWQLGHMPLLDYVKKHIEFAQAMREVDPAIKLVAVGAAGEWSETILAGAAGHMDLISEHFYVGEKPGLISHVNQVPAAIKRIAAAHRRYRETVPVLKEREIPVALDEWNYWYGPYVYGELGTQYFLKDALGIAAGLNEYARNTDVFAMANYAQTVNVIGAIKTSQTEAVFDTTGLVLETYRRHFGTVPVRVTGSQEPLDVMACLKESGDVLTISVVNPTDKEMTLSLEFPGFKPARKADVRVISGDDPQARNVPGQPAGVTVREMAKVRFGKRIKVPALSVSLYELSIDVRR